MKDLGCSSKFNALDGCDPVERVDDDASMLAEIDRSEVLVQDGLKLVCEVLEEYLVGGQIETRDHIPESCKVPCREEKDMGFDNKVGIDKAKSAVVKLATHALGTVERCNRPLEFVLCHSMI